MVAAVFSLLSFNPLCTALTTYHKSASIGELNDIQHINYNKKQIILRIADSIKEDDCGKM